MKPITAIFLLLAGLPTLTGQQNPAPRFTDPGRRAALEAALPEVEKVFETYRRERGIPGLAFGVVIDGEVVLAKGAGVRDRSSNDPVTADTVFRIASMTKSFTALSILKRRDEGKLSLDDLASKWIPEMAGFQYPTRDSEPIRVRHLLTHSAGFPEDNPWGDRQLAVNDETLTEWLKAGLPFSTSPGTAYEYANYGFGLLGRIVSKASGMPYRDYVEKNILAPLGMRASTLEPSTVPAAVRASGYRKSGDGYAEEPPLGHGAFGSMGGMLTSAHDLGRYVAYQLSAFPPRDDEDRGPVKRSSMREMQSAWRPSGFAVTRASPDAPLQASWNAYGYGLAVSQTCQFAHTVQHSGGLPGFGSHMKWLPDYGVGIFSMTNLTYTSASAAVDEAFEVLRKTGALRPRELPPSQVLISTSQAIGRLWQQWDDREANELAADNLFLDSPADQRRQEIERLKAELGACRAPEAVRPENLLRGTFRMSCERGFVDVNFTLGPTMPPKVQHLAFVTAKTLDAKVKSAAESLASMIGSPSQKRLSALAASSLDRSELGRQITALERSYGSCRLGETLAGNGSTDVRVRLECARGPLDVRLRADGAGKITEAVFTRPPDVPCVP